jgi:hypothetical protein
MSGWIFYGIREKCLSKFSSNLKKIIQLGWLLLKSVWSNYFSNRKEKRCPILSKDLSTNLEIVERVRMEVVSVILKQFS